MRQSRLLVQQVIAHPRRIGHFRRRAMVVRSGQIQKSASAATVLSYIPGEFDEAPRTGFAASLRRGLGLSSDITLLVLLSPFFAVWFLYRTALQLRRSGR